VTADTSCMKAHVVNGAWFLSFVFLLAAFLQGRGGHGWLDARLSRISPCVFCSSSWSSSRCSFVMNHVFAVVSGMSLC
jgi:hypothetical protein